MGGLEGIDKRVGSRGKRKEKKKANEKRKADPPSAVDGLKGIDKRVGNWGKKKKKRKKAKGTGRAPADLHPPLNKKWRA